MTDPSLASTPLARIEAAASQRGTERRDLARRHAQLRERVAEAVAAIDGLAARTEEPA